MSSDPMASTEPDTDKDSGNNSSGDSSEESLAKLNVSIFINNDYGRLIYKVANLSFLDLQQHLQEVQQQDPIRLAQENNPEERLHVFVARAQLSEGVTHLSVKCDGCGESFDFAK